MKSLEELTAEATSGHVRLQINTEALTRVSEASGEGLFHTPLLALTILVIVSARRPGLPMIDLATFTLSTLVKHFEALRLARGRIQWSFVLRRRCADAVVFLENVGMVAVREEQGRTVHVSPNGRNFINLLMKRADEAGFLVRQLERAYRGVEQGGLLLL